MGKHQSGSQKRKRKEKEQNFIKTQKGAMDKFITKAASEVSSGNQSVDPSTLSLAIVPYNHFRECRTAINNIEIEEDHINMFK